LLVGHGGLLRGRAAGAPGLPAPPSSSPARAPPRGHR
jgi:hypothetical protein